MKKAAFILVSLLLVYLFVLLSLPHKSAPPSVATGFLGFTNSAERHEALFGLSNPPNAAVSLHSVRRLANSTNDLVPREAGSFSWVRRESWGLPYAITVDTTNAPLRVVFQFQQRSVGPRRVVEQVRELWGRITRNEREFFTGSTFFVTNETWTGTTP